MKSKLLYLATFVAGAAVGVVASRQYFKTKYELIAQEDIDSVKEVFRKNMGYGNEDLSEDVGDSGNVEVSNDEERIDYGSYKKRTEITSPEPSPELVDDPSDNRIIPPEELGENEDYEVVTLMYYSDHVLTDDMDEVIDDVEDLIGADALTHFGEYENDSVCVVNDSREKYYEILLDHRKLSEIYAQRQVFLDQRNQAIDEEYGSDD